MASNLETMGVSASFNDGGLTLADKILQIQRFNDGIILYGDKIIAQSADTVNLYALILDDKIPQSGETVRFYADKILVTDTASPGDSLYDDYYVTSEKTGSSWDYIGSGSTGFIQFNSEKINTYHSSWSGEVSHNGDKIHIKDGVLTYHDTSDVEQTIDVSAIDTTQAYTTAAFTVYYYWVEATTGSNGVANYQYTCTGAGKINFSAKSGGIQSEIYELLDAVFYDDGLTNHDSTNYSIASALSEETVDDGVQISKTASGSTTARYICNTGSSEDIQAEITAKTDGAVRFGFIDTNNAVSFLNINNSEWSNIVLKRTNNSITATVNGTSATLPTNNADATDTLKFFIQIYNTSGTVSVIWKDLKIYLI